MQRYQNNVQDQFGNAITSVVVTIRTNPGGSLATIFSDNAGTAKSNPFTNDSDGELFFYAVDGRYDIELTGPITETKLDVRLSDVLATGITLRVNTDIVTATPPTTEAVSGAYEIWDLDNNDNLARFGFLGDNTVRISNFMRGGAVGVYGTDNAGATHVLFGADPDGASEMYFNGLKALFTHADGISVIDTTNDNPFISLHQFAGSTRLAFWQATSTQVSIRSEVHGASILIEGEDLAGVPRSLIVADPDATVALYSAASLRFRTNTAGRAQVLSDGSTDTEARRVEFLHADATLRGQVGYRTNSALGLYNMVHGAAVTLRAEDVSGNERNVFDADPDAETVVRGDTNVRIEVAMTGVSTGEDAILCTANEDVKLYYNDVETFRTSTEAATALGMGAEVKHNDANFYPVGMNVIPELADLDSGNVTLSQAQVGLMLTYNTATARSVLLNNNAAIRVGATWGLLVGPSAGTLTGDGGTGVVIRWWNGSGWTDTAAAGNITIGVGQYTIWKETATLYWISGPTLS